MDNPEYLTVPELAEKLRIGVRTAYELVRKQRIPGAAKVGNQWRIRASELEKWLAAGGEAQGIAGGT